MIASTPIVRDVREGIADLLPVFTLPTMLASCRLRHVPLILGARRKAEMFPTASRLSDQRLIAWDARTTVSMAADEALAALFDPACHRLSPYVVLAVGGFAGEVGEAIDDLNGRLSLQPGLALLWMGSGGHVTPLHHDGDLVDGRWHLVVRGAKRFDLLPPDSTAVPRMPWWSLHHRFSRLYDAQLPDAWLDGEVGAKRVYLAPGQMICWPRRWWHRVEIAQGGTTVALSTRSHHPSASRWRLWKQWSSERLIGDVESHLESAAVTRPTMTLAELANLDE